MTMPPAEFQIEVFEIDLAKHKTLVFPRGDEVVLAIDDVLLVMSRDKAREIAGHLVSSADCRPAPDRESI